MRIDPVSSLVGLAGCAADWMVTRPWRNVFLMLTPLFIVVIVAGLVVGGSWLNKNSLAETYLARADVEVRDWENKWAPLPHADKEADAASKEETSSGDPGEQVAKSKVVSDPTQELGKIPQFAEMLYRRVQQLQNGDARSVFFVAMCYIQRGAIPQGLSMLRGIAPDDRIGHLPAHAWLTQFLLSRPVNLRDLPTVRHHAEAAMRWGRTAAPLLAAIAELYFKVNDIDAAMKAMQSAAQRDSNYTLPLAKLALVDKKYKKYAEESLNKAVTYFGDRVKSNPRDIENRITFADALLQQSNYKQAEDAIIEGLKLDDSQQLKTALSEIYRQVFVATSVTNNDSWTGDVELLDRAFRLDPNNMRIFEEVAKLARITGSSPHDGLMEQLRKNLAEGRSTSITHMWIAERYLVTNELARAIPHLEQAIKRDPTASRCWNNLAYCIAFTTPERLDEALKAADEAVRIAPAVPDFHDTRGSVLMKMNRPTDAITAFEQAIELVARSGDRWAPQPGYHERLSEAYAAAGQPEMAKTHQELAAQTQGRLKEFMNRQSQMQIAKEKAAEEAKASFDQTQPATQPTPEATDSAPETPAPQQ